MHGFGEGLPSSVHGRLDGLSSLADFSGLFTNCIGGRIPNFGAAFSEVGGPIHSLSPNQQASFLSGSWREQQTHPHTGAQSN
jgi:hypothetical protein